MPKAELKANVAKPEYQKIALDSARESLVLLKNEKNILPLSKNKKVLVTGPTSDSLISLNNGWTYVWQGSEPSLYPKDKKTIQEAVEAMIGKSNFNFVQGTEIVRGPGPVNTTPTNVDREVNVAKAVEAAKKADYVVLCLGEGSYTETPGNITDITLPEIQLRFAEALIATGKPVIAVMVQGRPRVINRIADKLDAIVLAPNPGNEGGLAVADLLFGEFNPSGKLPFTYPRTPNSHLNYDHKLFEVQGTSFGNVAFKPQFEFGHGLSYTTFEYSDLKLGSKTMSENGTMSVSVKVRNTGKRAGKETVILYVRDEVATLSPPGKRVRRFAKVMLNPGEQKELNFVLDKDDLSFYAADNSFVVEPGKFTVLVGDKTESFELN